MGHEKSFHYKYRKVWKYLPAKIGIKRIKEAQVKKRNTSFNNLGISWLKVIANMAWKSSVTLKKMSSSISLQISLGLVLDQ